MVSRHLLATPPQPTSEDLLWLTPNSAFIPRVAICHGGTYITSDNFSAQKISFQDSVTSHPSPCKRCLHDSSEPIAASNPSYSPQCGSHNRMHYLSVLLICLDSKHDLVKQRK